MINGNQWINGLHKSPIDAVREARKRVALAAEQSRRRISEAEAELVELQAELKEYEQKLCEFDQDIAERENVKTVA